MRPLKITTGEFFLIMIYSCGGQKLINFVVLKVTYHRKVHTSTFVS
jgi:hypothetical protein